ncbi:MAG: phosphoribosylamine--glycine ligase [Planctomycetota bacterium]
MKVLVIGSGGREHALCWKLAQSSRVTKLHCVPGNAGIELVRCQNGALVETAPIKADDVEKLMRYARLEKPDLIVIGPETPLVAGLVDKVTEELGIPCFGPSYRGAELEGSKILTKNLLRKHGIPTADYVVFSDPERAIEYVKEHDVPLVIKADGLAAGKGVLMCQNSAESEAAITRAMVAGEFGDAGKNILIEETLRGEETSVMALTDGSTLAVLPSTQDHKRVFDNDEGPNTGGMGAYSPAPIVTPELESRIVREILVPTLHALRREERPFKGVLYAGIMVTDNGPKVLEYNVRFGDPECQCILPRIKSDLVDVMEAVIEGKLEHFDLDISDDPTVCVVMAADGYPAKVTLGATINGLNASGQLENSEGVQVFHGGTTKQKDGRITVSGGRVLGVTSTAATLPLAINRAYQACEKITFNGAHYRKDIAAKALKRKS